MAQSEILNIATCQFPVCRNIQRNARTIKKHMLRAKRQKADIVHFSECALSGYAGVEWDDLGMLDWELLKQETTGIMAVAKELKLWVVLGSTHPLAPPHKPHNSLYLINDAGRLVDRYDKRFCMPRDLEHYTPGDHFVTFTLKGVKCALLICYDLRFPELYRELKKLDVQCLFQSFYNARQTSHSVHTHIMRQTMAAHAATHFFWVSMTNSSGRYAPYPSCFITPDGVVRRELPWNRPGVMVHAVDLRQDFYDAVGPFRDLALRGKLSNGRAISDPRSRRRTSL